tara:strand:+ start:89671 stop:94161 length:4491 start_codon:yes stop_codon:yes gene_type:complete
MENYLHKKSGMYSEDFEKDACGIGLIYAGSKTTSHQTVSRALTILANLSHRSALGADGKTSDGAGILMQLDHDFFRRLPEISQHLNETTFAVGMLFFYKQNLSYINEQKRKVGTLAAALGLSVDAWRDVPVNSTVLGAQARAIEPIIYQIFVSDSANSPSDLERRLYLLKNDLQRNSLFDVISLSNKTIVYKGLSLPSELGDYYLDLKSEQMHCQYAMVHSRFSTNTLPAWRLAQPFSTICHNGEINTLRGNLTWLRAREQHIRQQLSPQNPGLLAPLILKGQSDSQYLDDTVSALRHSGYLLPKTLMALMPDPSASDPHIKSFYDYFATRLEPWDGPAAVCFCDGDWIGAKLDRNGLRPCRYQILNDGSLVLGSEMGTLNISNSEVKTQGRLGPGQMLAIDIQNNQIYLDFDIKSKMAQSLPFKAWMDANTIKELSDSSPSAQPNVNPMATFQKLRQFNYSREEIESTLLPMFQNAEEASSSMGKDTPLAILSEKPQILFNYFRQMFAQVTNPPMDSIRENLVMSLATYLGHKPNLLEQKPNKNALVKLKQPVLSHSQYQQLVEAKTDLSVGVIATTYDPNQDLEAQLDVICEQAVALASSHEVIVLSDLNANSEFLAIPSLLSLSAVHHHLINRNLRTCVSLVVASNEVRDVHHFACLLGYGAEAIYPALAYELANYLSDDNQISQTNRATAINNYTKAINKGLLKIISKMGISTLQSYCGAQVFEIVGLNSTLVQKYFPGSVSRIEGVDLNLLKQESVRFQTQEFTYPLAENEPPSLSLLATGGEIHYREGEEIHLWNPSSISYLQNAVRSNNALAYQSFSANVASTLKSTLRGFLNFKSDRKSISLEDVEPIQMILRRFTTGAMSLGALGTEAHESLAIAMNRIGAKSNSGEGGEDAARFNPDPNGDKRNSAIKQIASARFGVTAHYLANAIELQIKMAQGAKPGEGGQLPGHKVDSLIAGLRHATPGVTLISPPPHHDIYSIEDLAQLIFDLKKSNPGARISVKLVAEAGIGTVAAGVAKAMADKIVISGDSGGTGASPYSSIKYAGIPWEMGLSESHQTLVRNGLRDRVVIETDGQLKTGHDVVIAALLGADEFGFSTAPLIAQGCIMMRKCHLNTCPVGIATQDPVLRKKFAGQPEHVINYFHFIASEVRQIMSRLGFRSFSEMIGRTDILEFKTTDRDRLRNPKLTGLDLSALLSPATCLVPGAIKPEKENLSSLEQQIEKWSQPIFKNSLPLSLQAKIGNRDRSIGTRLSYHVVKHGGANGLIDNSLNLNFQGTAGQSFGAFLAKGISLNLIGTANDYVGKGLSGGKISIQPPKDLLTTTPISLAGNTCLYGATSGDVYIAGAAGERFAVRNSGARAIVEGAGDHGCEYMTGGEVIVLGSVGKNFAAGMSGGIAYVLDVNQKLHEQCNLTSAELIWALEDQELDQLKDRIQTHFKSTQSSLADTILKNWNIYRKNFVKVFPTEYKKILSQTQPIKEKRPFTFEVERA